MSALTCALHQAGVPTSRTSRLSPFGWGTPDKCGNVRVSTTTLGFFAALFYLDGLGYIVLTAALYHPAFTRYRRLTRWALIALTAATIVAYFALVQGHLEPALDNRPGLADARVRQPIGSNELGARRVGIKVDRHLIMIYAPSGLMAGFGSGAVTGPVRYHHHRRTVADQPQRHRRRGDRRHVLGLDDPEGSGRLVAIVMASAKSWSCRPRSWLPTPRCSTSPAAGSPSSSRRAMSTIR